MYPSARGQAGKNHMANSFFHFKQFTVHQNNSVMKVCTDSCILGAWTALRTDTAKRILDIGTGTGLLSLMLAQGSEAKIYGIESDPCAAGQARENILQSPWADRIDIMEADVRNHRPEILYDFIICNPPFYSADLQSPDKRKNQAKHEESLTLEELMNVISSCLSPDGRFSILLPFQRKDYFLALAKRSGFFRKEDLILRQTPMHSPFRYISLFGFAEEPESVSHELVIKENSGKYSEQMHQLMIGYYSASP